MSHADVKPAQAIPLSIAGARVRSTITSKARSIELLWSLALPVPSAIAVVMNLDAAGTGIRDCLRGYELDAMFGKLGATLAIRSSGADEDGSDSANAGRFATILDVPNDRADVVNAIVEVANSYGSHTTDCCVIVQDYIRPAYGGVLFTLPARGSGEVLVEWNTDQVSVTAGTSETKHVQVDLSTTDRIPGLPESTSQVLAAAVLKLKDHFPNGIDLEWLVDSSGKAWIVQVRPVTAQLSAAAANDDFVHDIDDLGPERMPDGSQLASLVDSFNVKRRWARLTARSHSVDYAATFVAQAPDPDRLVSHWASVRERIRTPLVTLKTAADQLPLTHAVVPADTVKSRLLGMDALGHCEMYVAEYFEPEACGLSGRLEGGGYLIEFVPGDIQALYSGDTSFSAYHVDADGSVLDAHLETQSHAYRLDRATGKASLIEIPAKREGLSSSVIAAVIRMTDAAVDRFGEARVEWLTTRGQVVMFDLSVEEGALPRPVSTSTRILSAGHSEGHALKVTAEDLTELRSVIKLHRSVVASAEESAALADPEVVAVRDNMLNRVSGPPIVVSDFPDLSLSVFLERAAGFVFSAGAVLSHLGIIIRESGKPALVTSAATGLETGDRVWIEGGSLHYVSRADVS